MADYRSERKIAGSDFIDNPSAERVDVALLDGGQAESVFDFLHRASENIPARIDGGLA